MDKVKNTRVLMESYMKHFAHSNNIKYQSKNEILKDIDILINDMKQDKRQMTYFSITTTALHNIKAKLVKLPELISDWDATYVDELNDIADNVANISSMFFENDDILGSEIQYVIINGKRYDQRNCVTELLGKIIRNILRKDISSSPSSDLPF